tara:strand:+ start:261 stop:524 length:264 start_codon:yes stop_codon:yes gene_type:complete
MTKNVSFPSALPDDIDDRVEKIQSRLEELAPELADMEEELYKIGWDLEDYYKDLWESANNRLRSEAHRLSDVHSMAKFLKNFRVEPH